MKSLLLAALIASGTGTVDAAAPPMPAGGTDPERCAWVWQNPELPGGGTLGVWTERCEFDTGVWIPAFNREFPGFELTVDGAPQETVIQVFDKHSEGDPTTILTELRARGYIPDDDECTLAPASDATLKTIGPAPRTRAFYEVMPIGARLDALEATPADEVPEPPCGAYGWSTHGVRYFMTDMTHPTRVIYVNLGQDGTMFDPRTITLE